MRYNISIPQTIMQELDNYAKANKYNRSEAIREAIRRLCAPNDDIKPNNGTVDDIVIPDFSKKAQSKGSMWSH